MRGEGEAAAVALEGVRFAWSGSSGFVLSVPGFEVRRGERLFLLGPSGSGKSTLLSLICGVVAPQQGRVAILGEDLGAMPAPARDRFRAERMGVIFQMFNLLPYATALDNVLLGLAFAPERRARARAGNGAERGAANRLLTALGLPEAILRRAPAAELSVGQQQRVAVARALIGGPEIVIADEPTSALDAAAQDAFLGLLFESVAQAGATLIMVSHDERLSARFDRAVRLPEIAEASC